MPAYALVVYAGQGEAVEVTIPTCRPATEWEIRRDLKAWMEGVLTTVRRQDDAGLKHSADEGAAATYGELQNTELVAKHAGSQEPHKYWVAYSFPSGIGPIQDESAGLLFSLKFGEELAKQAGQQPLDFSYAATGIIRSKGRIDPVDFLPEKGDAALDKLRSGGKFFYLPPEEDDSRISADPEWARKWARVKARADEQGVQLCPVRTVREALNKLGILPPEVCCLAPRPGSKFPRGKPIHFQGEATDPVEGPLQGPSLVWKSQRDGQLGTGETLCTARLSQGAHTITLTATNSRGTAAIVAVPYGGKSRLTLLY